MLYQPSTYSQLGGQDGYILGPIPTLLGSNIGGSITGLPDIDVSYYVQKF